MIGKGLDCLTPIWKRFTVDDSGTVLVRLRCGKCLNCRQYKAMEWSLRLDCEAKYWDKACFVTLTYDNDHLPTVLVDKETYDEIGTDHLKKEFPVLLDSELNTYSIPSVNPHDISSYIKRVRKYNPHKIRYFGVCEYGSLRARPHLHLLIFGMSANEPLDRAILSRCWQGRGIIRIDPVYDHTTAVYIAGYVAKKLFGSERIFTKDEQVRCSQHLGEQWLLDHISEFNDDHAYICQNGYKKPLPAQFRKILIEKGVLSPMSISTLGCVQWLDYSEFLKDCNNKNVTVADVFEIRRKNALHTLMRKMYKRYKTGDI